MVQQTGASRSVGNGIGHVGNPNHVVTLPFENSAAKSQVNFVVLNAQYQRFPDSAMGRRFESSWFTKWHPRFHGGEISENPANRRFSMADCASTVNTRNSVLYRDPIYGGDSGGLDCHSLVGLLKLALRSKFRQCTSSYFTS